MVYEIKGNLIIIEVDENQHGNYANELDRMLKIAKQWSRGVTFIRYNPDGFKNVSTEDKLMNLKKQLGNRINWYGTLYQYDKEKYENYVFYMYYERKKNFKGENENLYNLKVPGDF
eukprot:TRINITY_DN9440_c0_g1_i1.p2 TRINITY_DN9440_c0_g1~~TRINITY_DN9440_c0_g1_i1.p2  ORF type:complete len:116 (+),score=2.72 TRINITY_DN9440_c0_g1_i1:581-928(+)